jgi:hypothetical protein
MRIGRRAFVFFEHQCTRERATLAGRQRSKRLVEYRIEQIADSREAERCFALGGQRLKHTEAVLLRFRNARPPERGLPDSCLALENERGRSVGDAGEEVPEDGKLGIPADDVTGHHRPIVRRYERLEHPGAGCLSEILRP